MARFVLGIDQGTTQTTAVLVNETGMVVAKHSVLLKARFPKPGWVEQDPMELVASVVDACKPLLESHGSEIEAVGFDNQGETFVLWDVDSGQPLTPMIVWQDARGEGVCEALKAQEDVMREKTGLFLQSYFSAPKLKQILDEQPTIREAAEKGKVRFGTTETWTLYCLSSGRLHITDPSTAARTLLFNVHTRKWDPELMEIFTLPASILPKVVPSKGLLGECQFGDGVGRPIHAMLVDQTAALFGQACFREGDMKCSFGTGSFLLQNTGSKPVLSSNGLLTTIGWDVGDVCYALDGAVFVTGSAVAWLRDTLKGLDRVEASSAFADSSNDDQVVVVPSFQGLAAPYWQSNVRCAMFGISRSTSACDITRATLEGIALRVFELVQAMLKDTGQTPKRLKVDGGPSQNSFLMQRIADFLEVEVHVAANTEATAVGIANLARASCFGTSLSQLEQEWKVQTVYRPSMVKEVRQAKLESWNRAVESTKHFHKSK